ncbi:hypothetical protein RRG08_005492 [Elysia crispata]|uniref:Uncharacterized protein n=1 Tax=Elysia crispata TaxID=231223 RepID=A0AAE0Y201_9GAST|nr:hypothetical protein RRG08_005492 [Elysia crispata]
MKRNEPLFSCVMIVQALGTVRSKIRDSERISLEETSMMGQDAATSPDIDSNGFNLELIHQPLPLYLGSTTIEAMEAGETTHPTPRCFSRSALYSFLRSTDWLDRSQVPHDGWWNIQENSAPTTTDREADRKRKIKAWYNETARLE